MLMLIFHIPGSLRGLPIATRTNIIKIHQITLLLIVASFAVTANDMVCILLPLSVGWQTPCLNWRCHKWMWENHLEGQARCWTRAPGFDPSPEYGPNTVHQMFNLHHSHVLTDTPPQRAQFLVYCGSFVTVTVNNVQCIPCD